MYNIMLLTCLQQLLFGCARVKGPKGACYFTSFLFLGFFTLYFAEQYRVDRKGVTKLWQTAAKCYLTLVSDSHSLFHVSHKLESSGVSQQ